MKFLEDCKFEWILFFILQLFLWPRALSLFLNNARTSCLSLLSDVDNLPVCFGEQRASTRPTPCIRSEKERRVSSPFPAFRIPRDVLIPWHMSRQRDRKLREGKQSGGNRPARPRRRERARGRAPPTWRAAPVQGPGACCRFHTRAPGILRGFGKVRPTRACPLHPTGC